MSKIFERSKAHHVKKSFHGTAKLGLFDFELWKQIDEPLEGSLISIDPEEVDFSEVHDCRWDLGRPRVLAARTRMSSFIVAVHDWL